MLRQAESGFFKGMNTAMSCIAILMLAIALVTGTIYADATSAALDHARQWLTPFLAWYYVLLVAFLLFLMIWLGTGRYKNVRLGADDEVPEFTFFSWVSMLFAAGTGVGIIFWSVAQPILQFQDNPFVEFGSTDADAAIIAMRLTFFHWGVNGWAIFSFVGLVLAYFSFRQQQPLTIRFALRPLLGDRIYGSLGNLVDLLAVFGTVFGIATTLGLGVQQMNAGLEHVFGIASSARLQLIVIVTIMLIATLSVISGVSRGVRLLSEINFWLSIAAVLFMLMLGPTQYLVAITIEATGNYIQNLLSMSLHTNATHRGEWQATWTVFFWGWWLAWSPFVGMFIARISRGRTFREFVMGVLLVPTLITIVWVGLFGGTALYQELFQNGGVIEAVYRDIASALFVMIDGMSLGQMTPVVSTLLIILIGTYLITSANAGTLVITTILSGGETETPPGHRVLWGLLLALLTAVLLLAGGLETLQAAVITAALPFSIVVLAMIAGLMKALHTERYAARPGDMKLSPAEPWAVAEDVLDGEGVTESPRAQDSARL